MVGAETATIRLIKKHQVAYAELPLLWSGLGW